MRDLKVILGSSRNGRFGDKVGKLVMDFLSEGNDFNSELLDLQEWDLPFYNEMSSMQYLQMEPSTPEISKWGEKINEADAFIIITPEYNHGYPAVLKNALDYAYREWKRKPVAFVSYSAGPIAGMRAVEQLRQVVAELHMADIRETFALPNIFGAFDEAGEFKDKDSVKPFFQTMVNDLLWWTDALKVAREK